MKLAAPLRTPKAIVTAYRDAVAAEVTAKARLASDEAAEDELAEATIAYRRARTERRAHQTTLCALLAGAALTPRGKVAP